MDETSGSAPPFAVEQPVDMVRGAAGRLGASGRFPGPARTQCDPRSMTRSQHSGEQPEPTGYASLEGPSRAPIARDSCLAAA